MIKLPLIFVFLIIFISLTAYNSFACTPIQNNMFEIVGSYQFEKQKNHGNKSTLISGCRESIGKYFIINSKATYTDLRFIRVSRHDGTIVKDGCYIKNSPFEYSNLLDFGFDKIFNFKSQLVNDCLQMTVKDERGEIEFVKNSTCLYEKINKSTVNIWGKHCAFKIKKSSRFKIDYSMTPACTNRAFLKKNYPNAPGDYNSEVAFYLADDLNAGSNNYTPLGKNYGKLSILPDSELMPVSTYFGLETARWPLIYSSDVSFGKVSMRNSYNPKLGKDFYELKLPFVVNNNCKKTCKNGMCASACSFNTPVVASITLKKRKFGENKFKFVDWWYQGTVVPGNYLGFLSLARNIYRDVADVNDEFYIKAEFAAPSISFRQLHKQAKKASLSISRLRYNSGSVGRIGLGSLGDLAGQMIPLSSLPDISSSDGTAGFQGALDMLANIIGSNKNWPPYYSKVCKYQICKASKQKFITLELKFKVGRISPSGRILLREIVSKKTSPIFGSSVNKISELPKIDCK